MKVEQLPFDKVQRFAPIFLDYISDKESLRPFYAERPSLEGIGKILEERSLSTQHREVLVKVLNEQYANLEAHDAVQQNIAKLQDQKTFTITTGHQLNLFTGPLYFIYKIVTVINACKQLKSEYPDYEFVPVYWMATEDHDFDEINHFNLFGKKYSWESDQTGPVGRFDTSSMEDLLKSIAEPIEIFESAYREGATLADACCRYVNVLFEEEGLVVLDADNKELKRLFAPVIEADILTQTANKLVHATNDKMIQAGYKSQAFAREINFFYLQDGLRERIVQKGEEFTVKDTDYAWDEAGLREEIANHPENFSPNVIMRPLYQETILPNLGYVGGPAEVAYWLQLKDVFAHYETSFPVLMPRNFAMVIDHVAARKIEKVGLSNEQLFHDAHDLKEQLLLEIGENHLLDNDRQSLVDAFEDIRQKAANIDVTLNDHVAAQALRVQKILDKIQRKIINAKKRNNDDAMGQVDDIKDKLFPRGGLQERHDNFLTFHISHSGFIKDLLANFDPFDLRFYLLWI